MAYAAYREDHAAVIAIPAKGARAPASFHVLDVTVTCADAWLVRRLVTRCKDVGVLRCEPLLHSHSSNESNAPRVRLMIRLPVARYAQVLHCLVEAVPSGEIGRLLPWQEHLHRRGLEDGR